MPNRKLLAVCILIAVAAAIVPGRAALSDVAPPRQPPGSSVAPAAAGTTMVQMLSENVTLWIRPGAGGGYVTSVTADFNFRNQGLAAEFMQARFPMESLTGLGARYENGDPKLVRNFAVQAGGTALPVVVVQEPFTDGPMFAWSTFPITFPVGKDVFLHVSYELDMTSGSSGDGLWYILQTGAGWYGTIGSAVVTFRFPYAVGPVNVAKPERAVITGNEVRFFFSDFEPDYKDDVALGFAWPEAWRRVLDLERQTGENPHDVRSIIALADAYQDLCEARGLDASRLAETTVMMGLTYSPDSADLHAEWAKIFLARLGPLCGGYDADGFDRDQTVVGLQRELNLALQIDPQNELALKVQQTINDQLNYDPDLLSTTGPVPATKTPTEEKIKTETATRFPATDTPTTFVTPTAEALESGPQPSMGIPAGWLIGAGIAGVAAGLIIPSSWKRWVVGRS